MIEQMLGIRVFGIMRCGVNERDVHLQMGIAKQAQQLGFRGNNAVDLAFI